MRSFIKNRLKEIRDYWIIQRSGLFDREYYLRNYLDIAHACVNPLMHFIRHGWQEKRNPSAYFDTEWYLSKYPGIAKAKINPLFHYLKHGAAEGRDPSAHFSTRQYLTENPGLLQSGINPLAHYLKKIKTAGHGPHNRLPVPQSSSQETNVLLRKPLFFLKIDESVSPDLIQKIHHNVLRELFSRGG